MVRHFFISHTFLSTLISIPPPALPECKRLLEDWSFKKQHGLISDQSRLCLELANHQQAFESDSYDHSMLHAAYGHASLLDEYANDLTDDYGNPLLLLGHINTQNSPEWLEGCLSYARFVHCHRKSCEATILI